MSRLILTDVRNLLWPRSCLACGRRTDDPILCSSCRISSKRDARPAQSLESGPVRRPEALLKFDRDQPIRSVLHRLKYGNCPWIGYHLGVLLASSEFAPLAGEWDLAVPVPLHRARLLERGYNQSEWIARGLSAAMDVPAMSGLLSRSRNTKTQTTLSRDERQVNVEGAFRIAKGTDLSGKRILLVDDTLTTGATLSSTAGVLVGAGAVLVQPVAVARATLRLDEEQPDDAPVIPFQTDGFLYGAPSVGYNL
jgi:ComF family protein